VSAALLTGSVGLQGLRVERCDHRCCRSSAARVPPREQGNGQARTAHARLTTLGAASCPCPSPERTADIAGANVWWSVE